MNEYVVTLKGYSYFAPHNYYVYVQAPSSTRAAQYGYSNEDDGELEVVTVELIDDEFIMSLHDKLEAINNRHAAMDHIRDWVEREELERQAFELRQKLSAALESEGAWR